MKQVKVCLGRFQPMTLGHLKMATFSDLKGPDATQKEALREQPNLKEIAKQKTVIFCIYTPKEKVDKKHPFDADLMKKELEIVKKSYPEIEEVFYTDSADICKWGEMLKKASYQASVWLTGSDEAEFYSKMAIKVPEYEISNKKGYDCKDAYTKSFYVESIPRVEDENDFVAGISGTKVRQALLDGDKELFKKMMPKGVDHLFDEFKEAVENAPEGKKKMKSIKESINVKSLASFIVESNISYMFETNMSSKDFAKHNYKYSKDVIAKLLNGDPVQKLKGGELTKADFDEEGLKSLLDKIENLPSDSTEITSDEFNKLSTVKNAWTSIDKSPISGAGSKGISTADQENITCILFKEVLNGTDIKKIDDDYVKSVADKISSSYDESWVKSWMYQTNQIATSKLEPIVNLRKNGTIGVCRTDDLKNNKLGFVHDKIMKMAKDHGVSFGAIDSSDIYCFAVDKIDDIENELKDKDTVEDILTAMSTLFKSGLLIGISLKKVVKPDNQLVYPKYDKTKMPVISSLSYNERQQKKSLHSSLTWEAIVSHNGRDEKYTFNIRDNGQGTVRFELVHGSGQRIGDVPRNIWGNPNEDKSLYSILPNLDKKVTGKDLNSDIIKSAIDDKIDWNDENIRAAFLQYFVLAAKISDISIDHLLSM